MKNPQNKNHKLKFLFWILLKYMLNPANLRAFFLCLWVLQDIIFFKHTLECVGLRCYKIAGELYGYF